MKLSDIFRLPAAVCLRQGCSQTCDCLQNRTESGNAHCVRSETDEVLQSTCKVDVCHIATDHESEGRSLLGSTGNLSTLLLRKRSKKLSDEQGNDSTSNLEVWP